MFKDTKAFSTFSVNDLEKAQAFYGQTLGLEVSKTPEGLQLKLAGGGTVFLSPNSQQTAATFTGLDFPVAHIETAGDKLAPPPRPFDKPQGEAKTDEKRLHRGAKGPNI